MLRLEPPQAWDDQSASAAARGNDDGPWSHWLPYAWQVVADADGSHPVPTWAAHEFSADPPTLAYWGPLLHLCMFGLGWPQPIQGLARWLEGGRDNSDARLDLINRWWGDHIEDFVTWGVNQGQGHRVGAVVAGTLRTPEPSISGHWAHTRYVISLLSRLDEPPWRSSWGGGSDPLHLTGHATSPIEDCAGTAYLFVTKPRYAVLLVSEYRGWYRALHELAAQLPHLPGEQSWRLTVVCQPVGVLGTYRRSRETGRWFAGRHRWHQLGWHDITP